LGLVGHTSTPEAEPLPPCPENTSEYAKTPAKWYSIKSTKEVIRSSVSMPAQNMRSWIPSSSLHTKPRENKGNIAEDRSKQLDFAQKGFTGLERQRLPFTSFLTWFEAFRREDNRAPTLS
jgi:hypothetical protein